MDNAFTKSIGICAIATYEPTWVLGNDWFEGTIPRKFVQHTGIQSRPVSWHDEVTMGVRAVLIGQTLCEHPDIEEKFAELFG